MNLNLDYQESDKESDYFGQEIKHATAQELIAKKKK